MAGFGKQGERVRPNTGSDQKEDVRRCYQQRDTQDPGSPLIPRVANMHMHLISLRTPERGFKKQPSANSLANQ